MKWHFKVFDLNTTEVIKETYDENEAIAYIFEIDEDGYRLYDYQSYPGLIGGV